MRNIEPPMALLKLWATNLMYKGGDEGLLEAKRIAAERLVTVFGSIQDAAQELKLRSIL